MGWVHWVDIAPLLTGMLPLERWCRERSNGVASVKNGEMEIHFVATFKMGRKMNLTIKFRVCIYLFHHF